MPYRGMLAAIYRQYPDMAVNSVVRQLGVGASPPASERVQPGMACAFDLTGTMCRSPASALGLESDAEAITDMWRFVAETKRTRWSDAGRRNDSETHDIMSDVTMILPQNHYPT